MLYYDTISNVIYRYNEAENKLSEYTIEEGKMTYYEEGTFVVR